MVPAGHTIALGFSSGPAGSPLKPLQPAGPHLILTGSPRLILGLALPIRECYTVPIPVGHSP